MKTLKVLKVEGDKVVFVSNDSSSNGETGQEDVQFSIQKDELFKVLVQRDPFASAFAKSALAQFSGRIGKAQFPFSPLTIRPFQLPRNVPSIATTTDGSSEVESILGPQLLAYEKTTSKPPTIKAYYLPVGLQEKANK